MNDARRKALKEIASRLEAIQNDIEEIRDEEQSAFDALPENMQSGDQGERMQSAIDSMDSAVDAASNAASDLETASE